MRLEDRISDSEDHWKKADVEKNPEQKITIFCSGGVTSEAILLCGKIEYVKATLTVQVYFTWGSSLLQLSNGWLADGKSGSC